MTQETAFREIARDLREHGPTTVPDLMQRLHYSRGHVYRALRMLRDRGMLEREPTRYGLRPAVRDSE